MAADPNQLLSALLGTGGITGSSFSQGLQNTAQAQQNAQQAALAPLQQQAAQQSLQLGQQQIAGNDAAAAQAQQYQQDVAGYTANPTPKALGSLIARYPSQAAALKQSYDALDSSAQQSRTTQLFQVYNAAKNGRSDLVSQQIGSIIQAEKAQGVDTSEAEGLQNELDNGDSKTALAHALAFSQAHLAVTNPDFAKQIGALPDTTNHYSQLGSGGIFDERTGTVARAPDTSPDTKFVTLKNADGSEYVVQVGGGDSSSGGGGAPSGSGSPAAGRTQFGWTPRSRNGGDNTDAAVDGKISGMSGSLGLKPTDPFPPSMSNLQIAQALTISEGGKGSIADRNNNPGNLTDPKTGKYRVFPTKDAGLAAAAAQVARNRARGQNSIATMVEGLPVGGSAGASAAPAGASGSDGQQGMGRVVFGQRQGSGGNVPGNSDLQGPEYLADLKTKNVAMANQVQAVLDTRAPLPPATARSPAAQALRAAVTQAEPGFDDQAYARRKTTIQQYTPGHAGPGASMLSAATLINHMYDMAQAAQQLPDHTTAIQNRLSNAFASGTNQPYLIKYNEGRKFVATELPKFLSGKAPTQGETEHNYSSYDPSMGASGVKTALGTDIDYLYGRYQPLVQAYKDATGKDLDISHYAPGTATTAKAAALQYYRQNGALPAIVTTPAQARALPHGSAFVTPDGRVKFR